MRKKKQPEIRTISNTENDIFPRMAQTTNNLRLKDLSLADVESALVNDSGFKSVF